MLNRMHLIWVIFFVLSVGTLKGQINEGAITYEYRQDVHRHIPADREELKVMIPQYRTQNFTLVFNGNERNYKPDVNLDQMATGRGGGRRMGFRSQGMEIYSNNQTQEWLGSQEFMGRNYLVIDTISLVPWRLGSEYMDIAGHRCQLAWYVDTVTNEEITAWFTLSIQPFLGPDRFVTLPGTILAVDINNGEKVWVARKIEPHSVGTNEISKPSRGERISRQDFQKMVNEQTERMRASGRF